MEPEIKRGPGRPPKYHEQHQQHIEKIIDRQTDAAEPVVMPDVNPRPVRPNRKPFGTTELKLSYPERPGYHRHWFNDVPGRIQRAEEAGYEHVKDKEGKNVNKIVGTAEGGGPLTAFLMEIPEEWFKADMAEQQKLVDEREQSMRRGELESQEGDGRYVPKQGISIKHGR